MGRERWASKVCSQVCVCVCMHAHVCVCQYVCRRAGRQELCRVFEPGCQLAGCEPASRSVWYVCAVDISVSA